MTTEIYNTHAYPSFRKNVRFMRSRSPDHPFDVESPDALVRVALGETVGGRGALPVAFVEASIDGRRPRGADRAGGGSMSGGSDWPETGRCDSTTAATTASTRKTTRAGFGAHETTD